MRSVWFVMLAACGSSSTTDKPAPTGGSAPAPVAKPVQPPPKPAKTKPAAPPDDPEARAAYNEAMKQGRKATDAKTYDAAIAAFDEALKAKPGDARAISERGYAKLLAGKDLDAASADFDAAAAATSDTKLLSMIWFNRGLTEEKRGKTDNAIAAFQRANDLRPTAAAKAKLKGVVCPVQIERSLKIIDPVKVVEADSWLALWRALPHEDDGAPTSEGEAVHQMTESDAPKLPVIAIANDGSMKYAVAVWKAGTKLRALPVGGAMLGRCWGSVNFQVAGSTADRIHVHGTEESEGGYEFMCRDNNDDLDVCSGKAGEQPAGTACMGGEMFSRDLVIDAAGKVMLVVEEDLGKNTGDDNDPKAKVKVTLAPTGLALSGAGCNRTEPF